ncbi:CLUMA_CG020261, isoform A [Clunio marinus]|uniref:CLIP domain-containing serine protease n=1 Tax=Clunio marinus TaxID=568069 RepID=A0A1J1J5N3_9DIPT|nr:CLUMA_CG020261, isoform A [Clunio marinus]
MKILTLILLNGFLSQASAQIFGKCYTPDQYRGDCVYFKSCPSLLEIYNRRPPSNQDRLFLSLSQCGYRDGQPLVCCRNFPESTTLPPPPPPTAPTQKLSPLPLPGECGIDAENRIYGGNQTNVDEYPWMALLEYSKPNNRRGFHCGGVLVTSRYVLTASHCVNGKDLPSTWSLTGVRLGEWDTSTEIDCDESFVNERVCNDPPVDVAIEEKLPHPNYDPFASNQHNDIALLRLIQNVPFSIYVRPICLPVDSSIRNKDFVKQTLSVAGWGKTEKVSASNLKLKVNVDGVSNDDCQRVYSSENRQIVDSQVCAGGKKGFDSCRGDSGGPLMRQNERGTPPYWYLVGLVSYGPSPCGMEGWPGVYTRVSNYIDWIEQTIKP